MLQLPGRSEVQQGALVEPTTNTESWASHTIVAVENILYNSNEVKNNRMEANKIYQAQKWFSAIS